MSQRPGLLLLVGLVLAPSWAAAQPHFQCLLPQGNVLWAGTFGSGALRSADGGRTWTPADLPAGITRVLSLASPCDGALLAGTEGEGVLRSDDEGKTWTRWSEGLSPFATVEALHAGAAGAIWAGTSDDGLVQRRPGDTSWRKLESWASRAGVSLVVSRAGLLLAGTLGDGLWQTKDEGRAWSRSPGIPEDFRVRVWAEARTDRAIVGDGDGVLYSIEKDAKTWTRITKASVGGALYQIMILPDGRIIGTTNLGLMTLAPDASRWVLVEPAERLGTSGSVLWKADDGTVLLAGRAEPVRLPEPDPVQP